MLLPPDCQPLPHTLYFPVWASTDSTKTAELKLSDLFEDAGDLGIGAGKEWCLELRVRVININKRRNEGIIKRSETLNGYSTFVAKVREYEQAASGGRGGKLSEAEKLA